AHVGELLAGEYTTMTVASFSDSDSSVTAGSFTATVDWGDGTALDSATTISQVGSNFVVQGHHTYATDSLDATGGMFQVVVTVHGPAGSTLTETHGVHVERPPIMGFANEIAAKPGVAFTNVKVASFIEPDLSDDTGEFAATIYWGDSTSSSGMITG